MEVEDYKKRKSDFFGDGKIFSKNLANEWSKQKKSKNKMAEDKKTTASSLQMTFQKLP